VATTSVGAGCGVDCWAAPEHAVTRKNASPTNLAWRMMIKV